MLLTNPPLALADNVWMLGTAAYPLYLVQGQSESAVFEGGTGAMGSVLREQLSRLGVDAQSLRQIIVTHAHPDHVMAVPLFRKIFPHSTVVASDAASKTLAAEKAVSFFLQVDEALTAAMLKAGWISPDDRPQPLEQKQIAVDRIVKDGDVIAVAPLAFCVLETPGHSECSLSFFEPERKLLLISDATGYYMPEQGEWWPNYFTDYGAYLASIERLAGLGAEVLCLSHNAAIRGGADVAAYFQGAIAATQAYHERIVSEVRAGRPTRELASQLGIEIHAKTPILPVDFFQKNCALLIKQSLRHERITPAA